MRRMLLLAALGTLALAPGARAGGPAIVVGAAEDIVKQPDLLASKAQMNIARLAGLRAIRSTAIWAPGQTQPSPTDLTALKNAADAAQLDAMTLSVAVYQFGSKTTPLTDKDQADFASFAASLAKALPSVKAYVVGNEPNINRFWLPQFALDGSDQAAVDYERLLARTYDALKAVSPKITVLGGAVSPRGGDNPNASRLTHSPTTFIPDLGAAYRASGRTLPIMDAFAFHPYMDNSSQAPTFQHPKSTTVSINDYGKLVTLLGRAFNGTAQPGSSLPILYDEFGVESRIPAGRAALYTGAEPSTTKAATEVTQAEYYRQALALAFCQPNVTGIYPLHTLDEPALDRWQSGLYYADGTPKSSLAPVRAAAGEVRRGVIAHCDGLHLPVKVSGVVFPTRAAAVAGRTLAFHFRCDLDCTYRARLERLPTHATVLGGAGRVVGSTSVKVTVPGKRLRAGTYRFTIRLTAAINPGTSKLVVSPAFVQRPAARKPATASALHAAR